MFLTYVFQSILMTFMMYTKITYLRLNVSRQKKTYWATINVTCWKMKDSSNLHLSSSRFYATKQTTSSTTTGFVSHQRPWCFVVRSIAMVEKTTSTSTLINIQLQKMILKKISLSWWTAWSLVSLLCVYLFFYIDSFIAGKVFFFMIICSYVLIDSFIVAKISIFMFICSYVLIHSLQVQLLSLCYLFWLLYYLYWFINFR